MFTDSTATPSRVELLVDITRSMSGRTLTTQVAKELLQPPGLPDSSGKFQQPNDILSAARDLQLIVEDAQGQVKLSRMRVARRSLGFLKRLRGGVGCGSQPR